MSSFHFCNNTFGIPPSIGKWRAGIYCSRPMCLAPLTHHLLQSIRFHRTASFAPFTEKAHIGCPRLALRPPSLTTALRVTSACQFWLLNSSGFYSILVHHLPPNDPSNQPLALPLRGSESQILSSLWLLFFVLLSQLYSFKMYLSPTKSLCLVPPKQSLCPAQVEEMRIRFKRFNHYVHPNWATAKPPSSCPMLGQAFSDPPTPAYWRDMEKL